MNKFGIIVQARLGASRLPSKIQLMLTDTSNVLEYQLDNLSKIKLPIVVAMPLTKEHKLFAKSLKANPQIQFYFGDENDVLKRYVDCADQFSFHSIVRVCADNPFLNTEYLNTLIREWSDEFDYLTYFNSNGIPAMKNHYGLFAEIIKISALKVVQQSTTEKHYKEHVTPYIYENTRTFRIKKLNMPEPFFSGIDMRLTLDTANDLENIRSIIRNVHDTQNTNDIVRYCKDSGLIEKMAKEINENQK